MGVTINSYTAATEGNETPSMCFKQHELAKVCQKMKGLLLHLSENRSAEILIIGSCKVELESQSWSLKNPAQ